MTGPQPPWVAWAAVLGPIAEAPLGLCPQFPAIAQRFEAWRTRGPTDRPVFLGYAGSRPDRALGRRIDVLSEPEATI